MLKMILIIEALLLTANANANYFMPCTEFPDSSCSYSYIFTNKCMEKRVIPGIIRQVEHWSNSENDSYTLIVDSIRLKRIDSPGKALFLFNYTDSENLVSRGRFEFRPLGKTNNSCVKEDDRFKTLFFYAECRGEAVRHFEKNSEFDYTYIQNNITVKIIDARFIKFIEKDETFPNNADLSNLRYLPFVPVLGPSGFEFTLKNDNNEEHSKVLTLSPNGGTWGHSARCSKVVF